MRKKFTTTIDEEVLKEIKIQAIKEGLNVSELIEKMFEYYIKTFGENTHDWSHRCSRHPHKIVLSNVHVMRRVHN